MQVIEGLENLQLPDQPHAVAVGGFDGFHVGHQYLLTQLCSLAAGRGYVSSVLTFEPLPSEYFAGPTAPPRRLTTHDERIALAAALCCDLMVILRFEASLARLTAREFCRDVLVGRLNTRLVMASRNHHLGSDRADLAQLAALGAELGFEVVAAPVLQLGDLRVSSSEVRRLLAEAHVEEVAGLLGRRYHLSGTVVAGRGLGRGLGFPTANLQPAPGKLLPADAVYAGLAALETVDSEGLQVWPAAISIGSAPTLGGTERLVEAHLITDAAPNLYGQVLRLEFVRRLRFQQHFPSAEALQDQIAQDVAETRRLCAELAHPGELFGPGRVCLPPTLPGCLTPPATDDAAPPS